MFRELNSILIEYLIVSDGPENIKKQLSHNVCKIITWNFSLMFL